MKPWIQLSISLGTLLLIVLIIMFYAEGYHEPAPTAPTVFTPDCKKLMRTSKQLGPEPKPELGIRFYQDARNQAWERCIGLGIRYRTDI